MYKLRSKRKSFISSYLQALLAGIAGLGLASLVIVWPASSDIDMNSRVFSDGLTIKLDRGSPAFAALEDTWTPPRESPAPEASSAVIPLTAGTVRLNDLAKTLLKDNQREASLLSQERASRDASSVAMAQIATQLLKKIGNSIKPREVDSALTGRVIANKSGEVQKKTLSLSEINMSREELLASVFLPIAQSAAQIEKSHHFANRPSAPRPVRPLGEYEGREKTVEDDAFLAEIRADKAEQALEASGVHQPVLRQVMLSGNIEFKDGLALTNPLDRLVIYREIEGQVFEAGQAWLREGRYSIFVEETLGQVVGELRTPYGDVIGRGRVDLGRIKREMLPGSRQIPGVKLTIAPVPQGFAGRLTSADDAKKAIRGAQIEMADLGVSESTDREGRFEQTGFLEGSSVIIRTSHPNYWDTMGFAFAGSQNDFELFSTRDGQALQRLIASSRGPQDKFAIIYGRATLRGRPVAGAKVELMTSRAVLRPIYFNASGMPDTRLEETSASGIYAFVSVEPGAHGVQAFLRDSRSSEPLVFQTEPKTVSKVDIEIAVEKKAKIKVFDAFQTDQPVSAEVRHLGLARGFQVGPGGSSEIRYSHSRGLLIFDAVGDPLYAKVRMTLARDRSLIFVPMIKTEWLEALRGYSRANTLPGSGTVVGFVQGTAPFIAKLEGAAASEVRVVYFNNRGEPISTQYGEPGGGFAIFNALEGFKTITIQPAGSPKLFASVVLVERNLTNVISHWIR